MTHWIILALVVTAIAGYLIAQYLDWRSQETHRHDVEKKIDALPPLSNGRRPR